MTCIDAYTRAHRAWRRGMRATPALDDWPGELGVGEPGRWGAGKGWAPRQALAHKYLLVMGLPGQSSSLGLALSLSDDHHRSLLDVKSKFLGKV